MSYHLIVHLKGKGNRHFGPDKVAVLHAWFVGVRPWVVGYDRPRCSFDRGFTVTSPELLRPAGSVWLRRAWSAGMPGAPESISRHRHQSARCVGDSQGRPLNDPMAIRR